MAVLLKRQGTGGTMMDFINRRSLQSIVSARLRRCRRISPAFIIVLLILCSGSHAAETPAQALKRVASIYQSNKTAVKSIEYDYEESINTWHYVARYAASGDKQYHAALRDTRGGGIIMPREVAWDGQRAYVRQLYGTLDVSNDQSNWRKSNPTPDEAVAGGFEVAAGLKKREGYSYVLVSSDEVEIDGRLCTRFVFREKSRNWTLTTTHAQDVGYWPILEELKEADGFVSDEISGVKYANRDATGATVYFPLAATIVARKSETQTNVFKYEVHPETLKINAPIDDSRFVLNPWPSEKVRNLDTKRTTPARDAAWKPAGQVGFPFDRYAMLQETHKGLTDPAVARETLPLPQRTSTLSRAGTWAIWGGITTLVLTAAGVWLRRRGLV
jgi:hypothetical protein